MQFFTRGNESLRSFLFLTASNEVFIENYTMAIATNILRHKFYYLPLRLYHSFNLLSNEMISKQVKFIHKNHIDINLNSNTFVFYTYSNKEECRL